MTDRHPIYRVEADQSVKELKGRAKKAAQHRFAVESAREAGHRRGYDLATRAADTRYDNEINALRNQVATIRDETIVTMDRETVKGWLALTAFINEVSPKQEVMAMSTRLANAIARELSRAYEKETQA